MFYTAKEKREVFDKLDTFFDVIMDTIDLKVSGLHKEGKEKQDSLRNELMDLILAISLTLGVKPKAIVENYNPDKIKKYAEEINEEVMRRLNELKSAGKPDILVAQEEQATLNTVKSETAKKTGQKSKNKV